MIRRIRLSGVALLALAGGAAAETPMEQAVAACGGTRLVLAAESPMEGAALEQAERVVNERLGGSQFMDFVEPGEGGTLVVSLPASDVDPAAFAPVLERGELGFHTVLPDGADGLVLADGPDGRMVVLDPVPVLDNADLRSAEAGFDYSGRPVLNFAFTAQGADLFARYTAEHIGERFAIVYEGEVMSAPTILEAIPGGQGMISGSFTTQEVTEMAIILQSGALPVALHIETIEQVEADPEGDQSLCPTLQ